MSGGADLGVSLGQRAVCWATYSQLDPEPPPPRTSRPVSAGTDATDVSALLPGPPPLPVGSQGEVTPRAATGLNPGARHRPPRRSPSEGPGAGGAPLPYFVYFFLIPFLIANHQERRGLDAAFPSFPGTTKNFRRSVGSSWGFD